MIDDTPLAASGSNRRENFRIDNVMPVSIRKVVNAVVPTSHIFPVAVTPAASESWEGGINPSFSEFDTTFALMLIEVNAKLDLLLVAQRIQSESARDVSPANLSMTQLLSQINIKLEHLLSAHHLARADERVRIDTVSLSASGIKLLTEEPLVPKDLVEVRMLFSSNRPVWVVVGGTVIRAKQLPSGKREVAITFTEISESVEDEITRYALVNQKKQIMARRGVKW
jgi:hypothetical protein